MEWVVPAIIVGILLLALLSRAQRAIDRAYHRYPGLRAHLAQELTEEQNRLAYAYAQACVPAVLRPAAQTRYEGVLAALRARAIEANGFSAATPENVFVLLSAYNRLKELEESYKALHVTVDTFLPALNDELLVWTDQTYHLAFGQANVAHKRLESALDHEAATAITIKIGEAVSNLWLARTGLRREESPILAGRRVRNLERTIQAIEDLINEANDQVLLDERDVMPHILH